MWVFHVIGLHLRTEHIGRTLHSDSPLFFIEKSFKTTFEITAGKSQLGAINRVRFDFSWLVYFPGSLVLTICYLFCGDARTV